MHSDIDATTHTGDATTHTGHACIRTGDATTHTGDASIRTGDAATHTRDACHAYPCSSCRKEILSPLLLHANGHE